MINNGEQYEKNRVYYTVELSDAATKIFEDNGFEVKTCSHNDVDTYIRELTNYQPEAIMCRAEPITAELMNVCKQLKVIGKQGAVIDNIDMDYAQTKGIQVVYAPSGNANSVAEHTILLMLACAKRAKYIDRNFCSGNFLIRMTVKNTFELEGKTLGVIGCGRISKLVMKKAKYGFNMNVIGYDPYVLQGGDW